MSLSLIKGLIIAFALHYLQSLYSVYRKTRGQPGFWTLLRPGNLLAAAIGVPDHERINIQPSTLWRTKTDWFEKCNSSVIIVRGVFPPSFVAFVADAEGFDVVNCDRKNFEKPTDADPPVTEIWGPNLLVTSGHEWRRHRKVAAPSFSEANTAKVWEESLAVTEEWLHRRVGDKTVLEDACDEMGMLTLIVLAKAAFGKQLEWPAVSGHSGADSHSELKLYDMMHTVLSAFPLRYFTPKIFYKLPIKTLHRLEDCYVGFEKQMLSLVEERRSAMLAADADEDDGKKDLLSLLLHANGKGGSEAALTDQEVLSDMFVFLLAGHETSANTLASALFLLSLYPSYQDIVHEEAVSVLGLDSSSPKSYSEAFSQLKHTYATIQESLRVLPPAVLVNKQATADEAAIPASDWAQFGGERIKAPVVVPKGTYIVNDIAAVGFNQYHWENTFDFKPERFLGKIDSNSWVPFSSGQRACIGLRFALAETVATLAHIMAHYHIEIPDNLVEQYKALPGESERDRRERLYDPDVTLTLKPKKLRVVMRRRVQ